MDEFHGLEPGAYKARDCDGWQGGGARLEQRQSGEAWGSSSTELGRASSGSTSVPLLLQWVPGLTGSFSHRDRISSDSSGGPISLFSGFVSSPL